MEFLKIWEILLRRKWIIIVVFAFFFITVVVGLSMVPKTYQASTKILFKKNQALDHLKNTLGLTGDNEFEDDYEFDTEIALATVRPLVVEFISALKLKDRSGEIIDASDLTDSSPINKFSPQPLLEIEQYEDSNLLEIIADSPNPEEAAQMANVFTKMYIEAQIDQLKGEYQEARTFINDQIKTVRQNYFDRMAEERDFKIKEGTVDLDKEIENLIDKIDELITSYENNERTIKSLEDEITQAKIKLATQEEYKLESKELSLNDQVQSLETAINEYLLSIAGTQVELQKDHPEYQALEAKFKQATALLKNKEDLVLAKENISANPIHQALQTTLINNVIDKEVAKAKREVWQSYIAKYQDRLMAIPLKQDISSQLKAKSSAAQEKYGKLLGYMITVDIAESMTLSNFRVMEPAEVPETPDFPKKLIVLILAILPGTFWAFGLAFFIEYIDTTIKSPRDLEKDFSLNVLACFPRLRMIRRKNTLVKADPQSTAVRHFRSLANHIRLTLPHTNTRTIMVTSAVEKEGKTCLATNLAITMSRTGQKVLLIDLAIRRPSIHSLFNLPNIKGAMQVIAGKADLDEVINPTSIDTLYVMTSGSIEPGAFHWIDPDLYGPFLDSVKQGFDTVIIDTSSIFPDNDAVNLGALVDNVIWIIGSGYITPSRIVKSKALLDKAGINLAGVILNKSTNYH